MPRQSTESVTKQEKSNSDSKKYKSWNKTDGGSDNMTSLGRLIHFFTREGGEMLREYIGEPPKNRKSARSKTSILNLCCEYFKSKGVDISKHSIKSKINGIVYNSYKEAYEKWSQSGEGAMGERPFTSGKAEFEGN